LHATSKKPASGRNAAVGASGNSGRKSGSPLADPGANYDIGLRLPAVSKPGPFKMNRRAFLLHAGVSCAGLVLASCTQSGRMVPVGPYAPPIEPDLSGEPPIAIERQDLPPAVQSRSGTQTADAGQSYAEIYGPVRDEPFPIPAVNLAAIGERFLRQTVDYASPEPEGVIVIDPAAHYLFLVEGRGRARRYGVGVGREGFGWSGTATINNKQEWPDWYPPKEMIDRQPEIRRVMTQLQSGLGMPGGPHNPLGARAMYLWQNNKDTLFRIHGTIEPWTIGKNVSSGCVRMINQDVIDLYERAPVGTKVRVLA
jgi:lipoprotein-anchoring transpeptidase ErfK/SrfK